MKPISITPSQRNTVSHLLRTNTRVATVEAAVDLLRHHSDPMVQAALKSIAPAIEKWVGQVTQDVASLIDDSGFEELDLPLEPTIIGHRPAEVIINPKDRYMSRVELFVDDGQWIGLAPAPERIDDQYLPRWEWRLNGAVIAAREPAFVKPGDVIEVGRTKITLQAPKTAGQ